MLELLVIQVTDQEKNCSSLKRLLSLFNIYEVEQQHTKFIRRLLCLQSSRTH